MNDTKLNEQEFKKLAEIKAELERMRQKHEEFAQIHIKQVRDELNRCLEERENCKDEAEYRVLTDKISRIELRLSLAKVTYYAYDPDLLLAMKLILIKAKKQNQSPRP